MNEGNGLSQGATLGFVAAGVLVVATAAAYFGGFMTPGNAPDSDVVAVGQPAEDVPEDVTESADGASPSPETAPEVAPEDTAETATLPEPPTIDTFRLDADGRMLISGRTQPDWETSILLDGDVIRVARADAGGQFAEFVDITHSDQPRVLSLSMRDGETVIASVEEVIIAPSPTVLVEATDATPDTDTTDPAAVDPAAEPENGDTETIQTQTVLLSDESGVSVLQAPESKEDGPALTPSVALDAITYSDEGQVQVSGRAQSDGHVRVYLDNAPITTTRVAEDGNWRSDLPEVDTGVYTLRIDEVDADGNVTSRVETPFKREGDIVLAETQTADNQTQITAVTVVEGSTLWAISRAAYGDGVLYVRVFEANKDRIRDPDLIYPGQIFTIPQ